MSVTRKNLSGIGLLRVATATLFCSTKGDSLVEQESKNKGGGE